MNFSEKLLALRNAKNYTQEQLAEAINVSRQSISKWENGTADPDMNNIVALASLFDVSTDYLLKSSEVDELSVKATMLQKQQEHLSNQVKKQKKVFECCLISICIYMIFIAVYFITHFYFEIWNPSVLFGGFLIASAIVVLVWVRKWKK